VNCFCFEWLAGADCTKPESHAWVMIGLFMPHIYCYAVYHHSYYCHHDYYAVVFSAGSAQ